MSKYIVTACRTVYESFEVLVDAKSESEAEAMVMENIKDGEHDLSWDVEMESGITFETEKIG